MNKNSKLKLIINTFIQKNLFLSDLYYKYKFIKRRRKTIKSNNKDLIYNSKLPKIFVIGHNKTGTTSLHKLFEKNGYKSLHFEYGFLSHKIKMNFLSNMPLLNGIEESHLYSDIECPNGISYEYNLFPQLDLQNPNSYFIYNYRNIDDWISSRIKHNFGTYLFNCKKNLQKYYGLKLGSDKDVIDYWKNLYFKHEGYIKKYFAGKSNLIFLNIDDEDSKKNLCKYLKELGFKIKEETLGEYNKSY